LGINTPKFAPNSHSFCKFQGSAYKNSSWLNNPTLIQFNCEQIVKRFQKYDVPNLHVPDFITLSPGFFEEEQVIAETKNKFLIKWKEFDSDSCTWEESPPEKLADDWHKSTQTTISESFTFNQ
jgi:hypothetical protein